MYNSDCYLQNIFTKISWTLWIKNLVIFKYKINVSKKNKITKYIIKKKLTEH